MSTIYAGPGSGAPDQLYDTDVDRHDLIVEADT